VKSYIFAPCIVYGRGEGFGNPISIQTVAIVQAAQALRRVYSVDDGKPVGRIVSSRSPELTLLDMAGLPRL
jgi:hypothetical protein